MDLSSIVPVLSTEMMQYLLDNDSALSTQNSSFQNFLENPVMWTLPSSTWFIHTTLQAYTKIKTGGKYDISCYYNNIASHDGRIKSGLFTMPAYTSHGFQAQIIYQYL